MSDRSDIIVIARQDEIRVYAEGEEVVIYQPDESGNGLHATVRVHRNNVAALLTALTKLSGCAK